jgi:hypothetical protein
MIILNGYDGCVPTRALAAALQQIAPDLVSAHTPNHADVLIVPRLADGYYATKATKATAEAWYDMYWAHPIVIVDSTCFPPSPEPDWAQTARIGTIGAPPRIPVEQRIALAEPVTTDHISDAAAALYGGREKLAADWTAQRNAAFSRDRSVEAYDWPALALTIADRVRALGTPPVLTPGQRAHVAAVRYLTALRAVPAAYQSVVDLLDNAWQAGGHEEADAVRALLPLIDPSMKPADAR